MAAMNGEARAKKNTGKYRACPVSLQKGVLLPLHLALVQVSREPPPPRRNHLELAQTHRHLLHFWRVGVVRETEWGPALPGMWFDTWEGTGGSWLSVHSQETVMLRTG